MSSLCRKHGRVETDYELQLIHWQPASKRQRGRGPSRGSSLRTLASLNQAPSLHLILGISSRPQPFFPLLLLPRELLLLITDFLNPKSHSALSRACWYLGVHLQRHLFTRFNKFDYYYPAMHFACSRRRLAVLKRALYYGVPPGLNTAIWDDRTPLAISAGCGNARGVRCLLENGADVDATGTTGLTPLAYALEAPSKHFVATVQALLEAGADPTCRLLRSTHTNSGINALMEVLEKCDIRHKEKRIGLAEGEKLVRMLVLKGAKTDGRGRLNDCSPLAWAVTRNQRPLVEFLLDHGADPNYGLDQGSDHTALDAAIVTSNVAMVAYLVSRGADANPGPSTTGEMSPIYRAVTFANNDTVAAMLRAGASPNVVETGTWGQHTDAPGTPLSAAINFHSMPSVSFPGPELRKVCTLLSANADPNLADLMGRRPLTVALTLDVVHDRSYIVVELLKHGADPNIPDENQVTPLARCITRRWKENGPEKTLLRATRAKIAKSLVRAGAGTNTCGPGMLNTWPLLEALSRTDGSPTHGDESNDYEKLTGLYNRKLREESARIDKDVLRSSDHTVTLTDVPEQGWNNPVVPVLLNAGAEVSQGLLDRVIY